MRLRGGSLSVDIVVSGDALYAVVVRAVKLLAQPRFSSVLFCAITDARRFWAH